jgi:hypothetical protein
MSLRQQQITVFVATVVVIFGLFATGILLVAKRLTTEATLQTALLLARQVEIALAQSLQQTPSVAPAPQSQSQPPAPSFWDFLGRLYPGNPPAANNPPAKTPTPPSRRTQVQGLIKAYIDRNSSIQAMWVLNPEGMILYSSRNQE